MIKKSLFRFYYFGTCIRYLQDCSTNYAVIGYGFVLDNIDSFFEELDELGLEVTKRAAWKLKPLRERLEKEYEKEQSMSQEDVSEMKELMNSIRQTLDAEIKGLDAYIVTNKRLDVEKLINGVSGLFAPDIFAALPEITRYDFSESGKCIAFERPTAAAFHMLRGTEDMLRMFYCSLVKRNRISSPLMWGDIVNDLRTKNKTRKYEQLYNNLDNIRLNYRNPTQHPEKIYDIQEVQDLWPLCVEVCSRMARILKLV